jgi:hypothetical protein
LGAGFDATGARAPGCRGGAAAFARLLPDVGTTRGLSIVRAAWRPGVGGGVTAVSLERTDGDAGWLEVDSSAETKVCGSATLSSPEKNNPPTVSPSAKAGISQLTMRRAVNQRSAARRRTTISASRSRPRSADARMGCRREM